LTAGPANERRLARVRQIYDAIVAGDPEEVMRGSAEAIEWRNPPEAIEPGTRRGKASFAEAVEAMVTQFVYERLEILDSAERDDTVAVLVQVVATGRTSGAPFEATFSNVFRFDGDRVVVFEWSPDRDAALRAVGADRWPGAEVGS
jgi:ketosteroid isomerase-like protein